MLKEMLQEIKEECTPETKVVATHKMTDPQKKMWKAYKSLDKGADVMKQTSLTARKKFWNKVEADLDDFDHQLQVNDKDWTIEIHEEDSSQDK